MFNIKHHTPKARKQIHKREYYLYGPKGNDRITSTDLQQMSMSNIITPSEKMTKTLITTMPSIPILTHDATIKTETSSNTTNNGLNQKILIPKLPMLSKRVNFEKFTCKDYIFEEKYDGERMLVAAFNNTSKICYTRTLINSNIFIHLILMKPGIENCIFDGELVYLDDYDNIISICNTGQRNALRIQYRIFDIQTFNGMNVMHCNLDDRKEMLRLAIVETEYVKLSKYERCTSIEQIMEHFHKVVARNGEGLMLKYLFEAYESNRRVWLKVKALHLIDKMEEYDLYAYRLRRDINGIYNILECGYYIDENFIHVTNVSSGINFDLRNQLRLLSDPITGYFNLRTIVTLIAEKITSTKSLRHPSIKCIRYDLNTIDVSKFL